MEITLFGNTNRLNEKHDFLSVFELLMYQKGKMHAKQRIWQYETSLRKNVSFECYRASYVQNAITNTKHFKEKKNNITKK